MNDLVLILSIPIAATLLAIFCPKIAVLSRTVSLALWFYFAILVYLFAPLFASKQAIYLFAGLSADRIAAAFILLTVIISASAITQAGIFFEHELLSENPAENLHVRQFYILAMLFLLSMITVFFCQNLGFLWMSIEATTLLSAGLVYFHRSQNSLEATWKYFIICSVGIALALLGVVLIYASSQYACSEGTLAIPELIRLAGLLNIPLFKLGFIFAFLGFATKSGVFPLHSWLPDAYSEAPAPASAMFSGALLNCALYAIMRLCDICRASGHFAAAFSILLWAGSITVIAAAIFLVHQHGIKRLWAYSSIENAGLMLVAIATGSWSLFLLQAANHSLAKTSLFLLSGNIIQATGTKQLKDIRGVLTFCPVWGVLLALSAFAVTGVPPFGVFISEWLILNELMVMGQFLPVAILLAGLALAFIAVSVHLGQILFGVPKKNFRIFRPTLSSLVPGLLLLGSLVLGFTVTPSLLAVFTP
ncbi:MAG: hypothetical protein K2W82_04065 [Candidatus Obscuribacterales bacterium]|nr:hypothetical protein [Candidatus Obscuribacterales bacterium]